jgi:ABC-type multidrug transport system fused ATPase/permease subunit
MATLSTRLTTRLRLPNLTSNTTGRSRATASPTPSFRRRAELFTEGLSTEIGKGGVGLSVGERQRVQIARALLSRPRSLVLDEATANLDFATEADVKRALLAERRGRTILVIAPRPSIVEIADRIFVLDGGCGCFSRFARAAHPVDGAG